MFLCHIAHLFEYFHCKCNYITKTCRLQNIIIMYLSPKLINSNINIDTDCKLNLRKKVFTKSFLYKMTIREENVSLEFSKGNKYSSFLTI